MPYATDGVSAAAITQSLDLKHPFNVNKSSLIIFNSNNLCLILTLADSTGHLLMFFGNNFYNYFASRKDWGSYQ